MPFLRIGHIRAHLQRVRKARTAWIQSLTMNDGTPSGPQVLFLSLLALNIILVLEIQTRIY